MGGKGGPQRVQIWLFSMFIFIIYLSKAAPTRASNLRRVFVQIAWQCRVLFACLRKLLAWNQNSLIFFAQAANACAVWVLACTNKPQYYHRSSVVLLGVDTVGLSQLALFVVRLTTLCLPMVLLKNDSF